ncbi:hypothetical protein AGMMS49942_29290 [Spirochaetia bacterium]|nr:hypothetical protein AGMMS49942_29290 [Spirochaetia bacterium]
MGRKVGYIHSEVETTERVEIVKKMRQGRSEMLEGKKLEKREMVVRDFFFSSRSPPTRLLAGT